MDVHFKGENIIVTPMIIAQTDQKQQETVW